MKQKQKYTRAKLLAVLAGFKDMINKAGKYPADVLDDIRKDINTVLREADKEDREEYLI